LLVRLAHAIRIYYFEQTAAGRMEDLEALSLYSPGHPDQAIFLTHLASAVQNRIQLTGQVQDLEGVIGYSRETLALCPPGHPKHFSL
jgi:hypothetical protein